MDLILKKKKMIFLEKSLKFIKNQPDLITYIDSSNLKIRNQKTDKEIFSFEITSNINNFYIFIDKIDIKIILLKETNIDIMTVQDSTRKIGLKGVVHKSNAYNNTIYIVTTMGAYIFEIETEKLQNFSFKSKLRELLINEIVITFTYFVVLENNVLKIYDRNTENFIKELKMEENKRNVENKIISFDSREKNGKLDIVIGFLNGEVFYFLDFLNKKKIKGFYKWHVFEVKTVFFCKERDIIFSGGKERVLVLYDIEKNKFDFLPRFNSCLKKISSNENEEFLSIELINGENRLIEIESFKTIFKIKNINPLLKNSKFLLKKRNCGVLRVDNTNFELVEKFDNTKLEIFNFNPTERNIIINPNKKNNEYKVDNIEASYDLRFLCTSEYLKRKGNLIFSKLKFFFYDKEKKEMRNLGVFNNTHLNNEIKKIIYFFDKENKKNIFITFCDSYIKFWKINFNKKTNLYNFKCEKVLKNKFYNLKNIISVNKKDENFLIFDLNDKSEIYKINQKFELERTGSYNIKNLVNSVFFENSLLLQTDKNIILVDLQNMLIEKKLNFGTEINISHLNKNKIILWFNYENIGKVLFLENLKIKKIFETPGNINNVICSKFNVHIFDEKLNFFSLIDKNYENEETIEKNYFEEFFKKEQDDNFEDDFVEEDFLENKVNQNFGNILDFAQDSLVLPRFKMFNVQLFDKLLTKN